VASYVRGHHERWDGKGYPDGLIGEAIPWGARILAAAETFDALTTSRSYRSAASVVDALERMHLTSAEAVDPVVMRALQSVVCRRQTLEFIRDGENRDVEDAMFAGHAGADGPCVRSSLVRQPGAWIAGTAIVLLAALLGARPVTGQQQGSVAVAARVAPLTVAVTQRPRHCCPSSEHQSGGTHYQPRHP
jgi:hypothetical protein